MPFLNISDISISFWLFSESEDQIVDKLEKYAEKNSFNVLREKARLRKEKLDVIKKPEEFEYLINIVNSVLNDVERELQYQFGE